MRSRRPPRTSYGYLAPPGARVLGWHCNADGCGTGDEPAPRSWPHPCRLCGRPVDPVFDQPWAHEAEAYRNRHDLTSSRPFVRTAAEIKQHVWAYKDARVRADDEGAGAAWRAFRSTRQRLRERGEDWYVGSATYEILRLAAIFDDIEGAAREVVEWHPRVNTDDLEADNERRTDARTFVSACIRVLEREASIGHPLENAVEMAMRDVAARAADVLTDFHEDGFRRIGEMRAMRRSGETIDVERRSPVAAGERLPGVAEAHAALTAADVHDDPTMLDVLLGQLAEAGTTPSMLHLLRARREVAGGDLQAAIRELEVAARATDRLAARLGPQIHATLGRVRVLRDPAALADGIESCRTGRRLGLRWWRRTTAADTSLARLLLWRALDAEPVSPGLMGAGSAATAATSEGGAPGPARAERAPSSTDPDARAGQRAADVKEAVRLARRRCRPWHRPGADETMVLHDAIAARDALSGRGTVDRRRRAWRRAALAPGSTADRARLAAAWVAWAVGTGDPELAAEAYAHLVALVPLDAGERYAPSAKQRVLAAAQQHTEEAGYWLARERRYREAVVALETGRAVGLSQAMGSGGAVADVSYAGIAAASGDGVLVYLAAATAGGYALVVAGGLDPQFVELPKLDRATAATLLATLQRAGGAGGRAAPARDITPIRSETDPLVPALRTLWQGCIENVVLLSMGSPVVTLIPVGLLSLLPLHAAGEFGPPGDTYFAWRQAGHYSAIRYAPNARSLLRCRDIAQGQTLERQRLLAVDVAAGHGIGPAGELRFVARETSEILRRWPGRGTVAHDCTWRGFHDAADGYTVWHLACHGSAIPNSIMDSRLYFADRSVTLAELRRSLRPGQRRLAVLSACESNVTDTAMPNEVVGLPSALLEIGFAGVIASAWTVDDLATAYLMTAFYEHWCTGGCAATVALNRAQRWLRAATRVELLALLPGVEPPGDLEHPYANPRYWAAFAYTGA